MRTPLRPRQVRLNGRPNRTTIIDHDEILSLVIDLETLSAEAFLEKYCGYTPFIEDVHQVIERRKR